MSVTVVIVLKNMKLTKKSLLKKNDVISHLKILNLTDKMMLQGYKYDLSRQDFNDIIYIFNSYINLYSRIYDKERSSLYE